MSCYGVAGFRVRSGRAVGVLLVGSRDLPQVLQRRELALSDPSDPATRQPYHADFGRLETSETLLAHRISSVRRATERSVAAIIHEWLAIEVTLKAAALVVGSLHPPETIANEHVRAHALEGHLFRTVLAEALALHTVSTIFLTEAEVYPTACSMLSRAPDDLESALSALGRAAGKPWRVDHKLATLAAWSRIQ